MNKWFEKYYAGKNSFIKVDHKTLYFKKWIKKGLVFVQDLLDQNGRLLSKDDFSRKASLTLAWLQYESIIAAIPKAWKTLINDNRTLDNNYLVFTNCKIMINNTMQRISEINTKDIYCHLLTDITKRPTSEQNW